MPEPIRVLDWDKHYETSETRKLVRLRWVPCPNLMGRGYARLLQRHGYAGLGVWAAILQVASKKHRDERDGTLDYTLEDLALESRGNLRELREILPTLRDIGWIALTVDSAAVAGESAGLPGESPVEGKEGKVEKAGKGSTSTRVDRAPSKDTPNPEWLVTAWNQTCGEAGMQRARLPLGTARRKRIQGTLKATEATKEQFRAALLACAASEHWQGRNDRNWRGSLESFLEAKHRDRWLDAGLSGEGEDQLRKLALAEASKRRVPPEVIYEEWRMNGDG